MQKNKPGVSRYIRTSWILDSQVPIEFSDSSKIRLIGADEASQLVEQIRKRNVFARHSWENNFYLQRAKGLANHTIIEVFRPGDPKSMSDEAEIIASSFEKVVVLSSTLFLRKIDLLRKLGISSKLRTETSLIISSDFRYLRSSTRATPDVQGVPIDEIFVRRFARCGFDTLASYIQSTTEQANRVKLSLEWLFDSRIEPRLQASIVKTSIALESLLILSESESLAQSLSERAAFILSSNPNRRLQISRILKRFYEVRSGVVHGSQKRAKRLTPTLLETVDRLVVLLYLVISSNSRLWSTAEDLHEWCETQRWGAPSSEVTIPFPDVYLKNVLVASNKEFDQKT